MKKLINRPEDVVVEALRGVEAAHGDLVKVHYEPNYVVRADAPVAGKVGIVSGGGPGGWRSIQYVTASRANRSCRGSCPSKRRTRPMGVTVVKNTKPMMIGLIQAWRTNPNLSQRRLRGASTRGRASAAKKNTAATIRAQPRIDRPRTRGQRARIVNTIAKVNPKARFDEPVTTSSTSRS